MFVSEEDDIDSLLSSKKSTHDDGAKLSQFYQFRRKYISVYLVIMLADWMQGTHM